jgi:hypothetical protein
MTTHGAPAAQTYVDHNPAHTMSATGPGKRDSPFRNGR